MNFKINFFPMPYILIIVGVIVSGAVFHSTVILYASSNFVINGLILGLFVFAVMWLFGSFSYFSKSAYVFSDIVRASGKSLDQRPGGDKGKKVDGSAQQARLNGTLFNSAAFSSLLVNLERRGRLEVSDGDVQEILTDASNASEYVLAPVRFLASIFTILGLFGTFVGLLQTIAGVAAAFSTLADSISSGSFDAGAFIKTLSDPLQGMSTAFSTSLFGIIAALLANIGLFFVGQRLEMFFAKVKGFLSASTGVFGDDPNKITARELILSLEDSFDALYRGLGERLDSLGKHLGGLCNLIYKSHDRQEKMLLVILKNHDYMKRTLKLFFKQAGNIDGALHQFFSKVEAFLPKAIAASFEESLNGVEGRLDKLNSMLAELDVKVASHIGVSQDLVVAAQDIGRYTQDGNVINSDVLAEFSTLYNKLAIEDILRAIDAGNLIKEDMYSVASQSKDISIDLVKYLDSGNNITENLLSSVDAGNLMTEGVIAAIADGNSVNERVIDSLDLSNRISDAIKDSVDFLGDNQVKFLEHMEISIDVSRGLGTSLSEVLDAYNKGAELTATGLDIVESFADSFSLINASLDSMGYVMQGSESLLQGISGKVDDNKGVLTQMLDVQSSSVSVLDGVLSVLNSHSEHYTDTVSLLTLGNNLYEVIAHNTNVANQISSDIVTESVELNRIISSDMPGMLNKVVDSIDMIDSKMFSSARSFNNLSSFLSDSVSVLIENTKIGTEGVISAIADNNDLVDKLTVRLSNVFKDSKQVRATILENVVSINNNAQKHQSIVDDRLSHLLSSMVNSVDVSLVSNTYLEAIKSGIEVGFDDAKYQSMINEVTGIGKKVTVLSDIHKEVVKEGQVLSSMHSNSSNTLAKLNEAIDILDIESKGISKINENLDTFKTSVVSGLAEISDIGHESNDKIIALYSKVSEIYSDGYSSGGLIANLDSGLVKLTDSFNVMSDKMVDLGNTTVDIVSSLSKMDSNSRNILGSINAIKSDVSSSNSLVLDLIDNVSDVNKSISTLSNTFVDGNNSIASEFKNLSSLYLRHADLFKDTFVGFNLSMSNVVDGLKSINTMLVNYTNSGGILLQELSDNISGISNVMNNIQASTSTLSDSMSESMISHARVLDLVNNMNGIMVDNIKGDVMKYLSNMTSQYEALNSNIKTISSNTESINTSSDTIINNMGRYNDDLKVIIDNKLGDTVTSINKLANYNNNDLSRLYDLLSNFITSNNEDNRLTQIESGVVGLNNAILGLKNSSINSSNELIEVISNNVVSRLNKQVESITSVSDGLTDISNSLQVIRANLQEQEGLGNQLDSVIQAFSFINKELSAGNINNQEVKKLLSDITGLLSKDSDKE